MRPMRDLRLRIPGPYGEVPALLRMPSRAGRFRGTVLMYHGLGASKDTHGKELGSIADRGFLAVGVDAHGHGERRAHDFEQQAGLGFSTMLRWIDGTAREVPFILDALTDLIGAGTRRFGITGISMGGYVAYAAAAREKRLEAIVPILASPDWTRDGAHADALTAGSPHQALDVWAPRALLALNAGRDADVPPGPSRAFVEALRPRYAAAPHRLDYVEYPESEHFMLERDWTDLWGRTLEWFERHLP